MGNSYKLKDTYTGMKITWIRASTLMPGYFIFLDYFRRNFDETFRTKMYGPFLGESLVVLVNNF